MTYKFINSKNNKIKILSVIFFDTYRYIKFIKNIY